MSKEALVLLKNREERLYDYYTDMCFEFDFEGTMEAFRNALLKQGDYEDYRNVIINHHNRQKVKTIRGLSEAEQFGFYKFANDDLKYLAYIFGEITENEYNSYIHYILNTRWFKVF